MLNCASRAPAHVGCNVYMAQAKRLSKDDVVAEWLWYFHGNYAYEAHCSSHAFCMLFLFLQIFFFFAKCQVICTAFFKAPICPGYSGIHLIVKLMQKFESASSSIPALAHVVMGLKNQLGPLEWGYSVSWQLGLLLVMPTPFLQKWGSVHTLKNL